MLATIRIKIGVTSIERKFEERFIPWTSTNTPFHYETDTETYLSMTPTIANEVWEFVNSEVQRGAVIEVHYGAWLDNVTHPETSAGVIRLAKSHVDSQQSQLEADSLQSIQEHLEKQLADLKATARY